PLTTRGDAAPRTAGQFSVIEVRTYDGDAAELSRFVLDVWSTAYRGRMPVPLWDARYFDWQIPVDRPGSREFLVAAYDGSKLIGFLGGERFRFSSRDGEFDVAMASWDSCRVLRTGSSTPKAFDHIERTIWRTVSS